MEKDDLLFYRKGTLSDLLFGYPRTLAEDVGRIDRAAILNTSLSDLVDHFVSKYTLEVPRLLREQAYVLDPEDAQVDVSHDRSRFFREPGPHYMRGTLFSIVVPFEGDRDLFEMRPSSYSLSGVRGEIQKNLLVLRHTQLEGNAAAVKGDFDGRLADIESSLQTQRRDVHPWNTQLPAACRSLLEARKKKVLDGMNMAEALGFPLRRRVASTYSVDVPRRKVTIQMPRSGTAPYAPEPALDLKAYEDILEVIQSLSVMMERSPTAFAGMGEEHVRDHILVILNAQFAGNVTGETFNRAGKTDILIREKDRTLFIAECKIWAGPKSLTEAIDQVLSYTSWRDTKVAVIVFNRRKEISNVLAAVPAAAAQHPCFKRVVEYKAEGGFRFSFGQRDDRNRELLLTVLVFDLPSPISQDGAADPPASESTPSPGRGRKAASSR